MRLFKNTRQVFHVCSPATREGANASILDTLIVWWVMILAMLPFSEVVIFHPAFAVITSYDGVYIVLMGLLVSRIAAYRRVHFLSPLILFAVTAGFSTAYAVIGRAVPIIDAMRSLRFFAPFFVAVLTLASGFQYPAGKFLRLLVVAALVSSGSAFYIRYFAPELMDPLFWRSEDIYRQATAGGRLYWSNGCLTFFVLLALFIKGKTVSAWLMLLTLVISVSALFAASSRTDLIGVCLFLGAAVLTSTRFSIAVKRAVVAGALILILVLSGIVLMGWDETFSSMADARFFGQGNLESVYATAITDVRKPLYEAYAEILRKSFLLGQGIGLPFIVQPNGEGVFVTDVAVLSFLLPFGVLGLVLFADFLRVLSVLLLSGGRSFDWDSRKISIVMLGVFFLMGLNADVFSRNNFVVFFTCFAFTRQVLLTSRGCALGRSDGVGGLSAYRSRSSRASADLR
jgi:O-antigen ligase